MTTASWQDLYREAELAGGGQPVPPGDYDVVVEEAVGTQTGNGKPMIKVKFKIITGPHAGRRIFNNFVVSSENANALSFFFQHMGVLGVDPSVWPQVQPGVAGLQQVAPILVGRQARIGGEHRDWQGRPQFDVKKIAPPTPGIVASAEGQPAQPQPQPAPQPQAPAGWAPAQAGAPGLAPPWAQPQPQAPASVPAAPPQFPQQPQPGFAAPTFPPAAPAAPAPPGFPPAPYAPQAAPVQEQAAPPQFPPAPQQQAPAPANGQLPQTPGFPPVAQQPAI